MSARFERYFIAKQLDNLARHLSCRSRTGVQLAEWVLDEGQLVLGIDITEYEDSEFEKLKRKPPLAVFIRNEYRKQRKHLSRAAWNELLEIISSATKKYQTKERNGLQRNIEALSKDVGLDTIETAILSVTIRLKTDSEFRRLCNGLFEQRDLSLHQLLAAMLGVKPFEISKRLTATSRLINIGLIENDSTAHSSDFDDYLSTPDIILRAVQPPNSGILDIRIAVFGSPCSSSLHWQDFDHIEEDRNLVVGILKGAIREKEKGVNILLYGAPGTGKTEFCKAVAAELDFTIYAIGEQDDNGNEPTKGERISSLRLSDQMLSKQNGTILLFDEMEDILEGVGNIFSPKRRVGSKVFINRLLESNAVPTLWTCNGIEQFDTALIRRMTVAVELKIPPPNVRKKIWQRTLDKNNFTLSEKVVADLAREFEAPPALAANAIRAVKLAGGGEEQIRRTVRGMVKVISGGAQMRPTAKLERAYEPNLLNADLDLNNLTRRIVKKSVSQNFSFCLYGPAGTGKSAYARHLADKMGLEVIQKRTSDLMSMWVGGTEKLIAAAFEEAQEREAFLIFDEADSLLQDRRGADRSWEVTQVNEMLTWMESHPHPFACTTNLMESLDPASLRRFTFKVKCDFLIAEQVKKSFRHFFNMEPPKGVEKLTVLTPGDFAVVCKKAAITGELSDPHALKSMLAGECSMKPGISHPIGFRAAI